MRYQVPQFIEVEDKIFGPLTAKQFIYLAGGGGICLAVFSTLPFIVATLIGVPIAALAIALAFFKVNGRPFVVTLEHATTYLFGKKLYLWNAKEAERKTKTVEKAASSEPEKTVPKLSESKLRDLVWSLNIKDQRSQKGL